MPGEIFARHRESRGKSCLETVKNEKVYRERRYIPAGGEILKVFQKWSEPAVVAGFVMCTLPREGRSLCHEQIVVDECKYAKNRLANVGGADAACNCNAIQSLVTARQELFGCAILFAKQSASTRPRRFV